LPPAPALVAVQLRIYGRVQGVWYRGWTVDQAAARGLAGWVRNRADGTVEALLTGPAEDVEAMIALCHLGPEEALVSEIEREDIPLEQVGGLSGFRQRPTA